MTPVHSSLPSPSQVLAILLDRPKRWLTPTLAVLVLAGAYALVRSNTWEASQTLILRNEAANSSEAPGKFTHTDEMKTIQETILELVKSRGVLVAALKKVGPPADHSGATALWPSAEDVASLRDALKVTPPKGTEFGKTEIFYLKVRDHDRQRAVNLVAAISSELETSYQELRNTKAQSMVDELVKAVKLAKDDLAESTAQLSQLETKVGSDLAELRILHESSSGESALRRTVTEIHNELRQVETSRKQNEELLVLLKQAQDDPDRLVATPNSLLEALPSLRRLKEGLIEAKLRTAELMDRRSARHPLVEAAKEAEKEIHQHLHGELASAIRAIEVDLRLADGRKAVLKEQLATATGKLAQLACVRAEYSNLVSETRHRGELLARAEQKLSEARISQATAEAASLIGRIDTPDTGANPIGPGRMLILAAGLASGLATGVGVVFLTVPPTSQPTSFNVSRNGTYAHGHAPANGSSLKQALERIAARGSQM
jgi:succinoglycan biosynthesis transport protein ExoP